MNKTLKYKVQYAELIKLVKKSVEQEQGGKERNKYGKHQKQESAQDRSIDTEIHK